MNLYRFKPAAAIVMAVLLSSATAQEPAGDKVDLAALAQIKTEAFQHSQVMENLFWMSEVYGPRVTNSANHKLAAEWAMKQMKEWGLQNVHLEKWPFGYGWQIKHFYAAMDTPVYAAFTGFPLAWTPGTNGPITVEPVWAPIHSKADFAKYHGKLKGKALLMFDPAPLTLHTRADAQPSPTDEEILARGGARGGGGRGAAAAAGAPGAGGAPGRAAAGDRDPSGRGRPGEGTWEYTPTSLALANAKNGVLRNEVNAFLKEEGVAISITPGYNGDGGTIFSTYGGSENPKDPIPPPIVAIGAEQYNRIVRLMQHGITPKLTFDIAVEYQKEDQNAFNVIGEIPGTTKPDEVVMLGGHFDSWQGGTGATDNGTGASVAMEALRILAKLKKPMARTVRVALWGGEEEGVYGSTAYVQRHFAQRTTMVKTPEYDKLDVYFNDDGGSGRFRGVSAGGSPQMAAIFKSWIEPIKDQHMVSVSGTEFRPTLSPGGTDSSAFSWIGLNGIGFQQDGLEYGTRTHHSNADTYDRVQKDDVMQASMIEAWFAYNAATRADMLPRIPTPAPDPNAKSHE
jgi:carboxypeptidase Q